MRCHAAHSIVSADFTVCKHFSLSMVYILFEKQINKYCNSHHYSLCISYISKSDNKIYNYAKEIYNLCCSVYKKNQKQGYSFLRWVTLHSSSMGENHS